MELDLRYVGFTIPSEFVVGYGLDVAERYRNLRGIHRYLGAEKDEDAEEVNESGGGSDAAGGPVGAGDDS